MSTKFTHAGMEFEPVESPEYIAECEATHAGYCMGVNTETKYLLQKCFEPVRYFMMQHHEEMFGPLTTRPYSETSADGTYRTASEKVSDYLNSLEHGILIPKGDLRNLKVPKLPVFDSDRLNHRIDYLKTSDRYDGNKLNQHQYLDELWLTGFAATSTKLNPDTGLIEQNIITRDQLYRREFRAAFGSIFWPFEHELINQISSKI